MSGACACCISLTMKFALKEIRESFHSLPMALHFAWGDTKARYRRSVLGPWWIVLGTALGVAGLGFLWSELLKTDKSTFIPSLTVGLVVWQLISGCITESSNVFVRNAQVIRNVKIPFLIFPLQMMLRQLINFAHNAVVIFIVICIFPPPVSAVQLMVIPGLLLLIGNLFWIALMVGILGARFRDLDPLINAFMPMIFFLSPVIFRPDHLPLSQGILWANPFTYFISIVRDPIQGVMPDLFVYQVTLLILVGGWGLSLWLLSKRHGRIAFWI